MISYLKRGLAITSIVLASYIPNIITKNYSLENFLISSCQAQQESINDGSSEPGFVPPPENPKLPPPPPANMSSAETFIPYPPPPAQPQSRSEKKNPPTPPTMISKIRQAGQSDRDATPYDVGGLLKEMKENANVNFSSEVKSLSDISTNPEKNPILYKSTHFRFSFNEQERKKLREYMLNGGTLIINPGRGSKPAFESAISEIQTIFPEARMLPLGPDHPIFHSFYDISKVECQDGTKKGKIVFPEIMGLTMNCRTLAIVPRYGIEAGWSGEPPRDIDIVLNEKDSRQLGMNFVSYATAMRAWQKDFSHAMKFIDADDTSAGKVSIAQIIYSGEWKTRHAGLEVLLQGFNAKTDIPVKFAKREINLSNSEIFNSPILYITGHEKFLLNEEERNSLREYLLKDGLLFAEACCGRKGFDYSFREQIKKVLPESEYSLEKIPLTDTIFTFPNKDMQKVGVTPALGNIDKKVLIKPKLECIKNKKGNYIVIYSPLGMSGGWEKSQSPYALGYDDDASSRLGENILMNAVTR